MYSNSWSLPWPSAAGQHLVFTACLGLESLGSPYVVRLQKVDDEQAGVASLRNYCIPIRITMTLLRESSQHANYMSGLSSVFQRSNEDVLCRRSSSGKITVDVIGIYQVTTLGSFRVFQVFAVSLHQTQSVNKVKCVFRQETRLAKTTESVALIEPDLRDLYQAAM